MVGLGNAKILSYGKHANDAEPPVEMLAEAKKLGLRAFQNYQKAMPFISAGASNLVGDDFYLGREWDDAQHWFGVSIKTTKGGNQGRLSMYAEFRLKEIKGLRK